MQVDKTTLDDLSIFHREEEQSVFHHLNFAQTNGGSEHLRYLLSNPLSSVEAIEDTQRTIQCLMNVAEKWPASISNGTLMMISKFFETQIDRLPNNPSRFDAVVYRFVHKHDFSLARYSVGHVIDFVKGLNQVTALLKEQPMSNQLTGWVTRIEMLLNKPVLQTLAKEDKTSVSPLNIIRYAGYIRAGYHKSALELIDLYCMLDAYFGLALACRNYHFSFPTVTKEREPYFQAKELYHPLLAAPVSYDVELAKDKNFLFLTGANMAGKSTFIRAVGIGAYLAHIGMGVPASEMKIALLDGMLSNIQVVDNILKGESFFFNEVQRIRKTVEKVSDGRNWLILIDELFKGTNQQDAVKCSLTVIEGLRKLSNAVFVLSTHLYEIGDELRKHNNIQCYFFETGVEDEQLVFSYRLKPGVSNDRIGYLILKREGVVKLLESL